MKDNFYNKDSNHIIESAYRPLGIKVISNELTGECPKCGRTVKENSCDYCPRCGTKIDWEGSSSKQWYRGLLCAEKEGTFVVQLTDQEYQGVLKFVEACQGLSYRCGDCDISLRGFDNPQDADDCRDFVNEQW